MPNWILFGALIAFVGSSLVAMLDVPPAGGRVDTAVITVVCVLFYGSIATGAVYIGHAVLTNNWTEHAERGMAAAAAPAEQGCHQAYEGECLDPNAYDYDCAGGSGDGPKYASVVEVVGPDEYGLDADGDGFGCE